MPEAGGLRCLCYLAHPRMMPSYSGSPSRVLVLWLLALAACLPRAEASRPVLPEPPDSIYFVMVDRFANGDPSNDGAVDPSDPAAFHGGDLKGLIDHLGDLEALGVRTVWLSPVFAMRTEKFFGHGAFHGYWTYDLNRVEPRFGTEADLKRLADELHRRNMRLLLDLVVNHVGPDAPLVRERPEWFHRRGPLTDWNDADQLVTHDVHGLPDLAQEREEVYRHLAGASLRWVTAVQPDGFRLDAVKHVAPAFWARFNDELRGARPGLFLLGEELEGDPAVLARVGTEGKFDAMFDFPLAFALVDVFCKNQQPAKVGAVLSSDRLYADPDALVTLLDNHDLPRVMTQCRGEAESVRQALQVLLTARGTPSLLYGTEAGLTGAAEPENRADMKFGANPALAGTIARTLALRRAHPALAGGTPWVLAVEDGLFAYARVSQRELALVAVNRRETPAALRLATLRLPVARWTDASGARQEVPPQQVPASSVLVAFAQPEAESGFAGLKERAAQLRKAKRMRAVTFEPAGAPGRAGERLVAVGSAPEMGAWNPSRSKASADASGKVKVNLPAGSVVELKWVARRDGATPEWEPGDNHLVFIEDREGPARYVLEWGRAREAPVAIDTAPAGDR